MVLVRRISFQILRVKRLNAIYDFPTHLHHSCVLSSLNTKKSSGLKDVTQPKKVFLAKLRNFSPGADFTVSVVKLQRRN